MRCQNSACQSSIRCIGSCLVLPNPCYHCKIRLDFFKDDPLSSHPTSSFGSDGIFYFYTCFGLSGPWRGRGLGVGPALWELCCAATIQDHCAPRVLVQRLDWSSAEFAVISQCRPSSDSGPESPLFSQSFSPTFLCGERLSLKATTNSHQPMC